MAESSPKVTLRSRISKTKKIHTYFNFKQENNGKILEFTIIKHTNNPTINLAGNAVFFIAFRQKINSFELIVLGT